MLEPSVPAWFEVPTRDLDRATRFYEAILGARLLREEMGPMAMAVFPHEKPHPSGALVRAEGYEPGARGTVVYLNLEDIRPALATGEGGGGQHPPALDQASRRSGRLRPDSGQRGKPRGSLLARIIEGCVGPTASS